MRRSEVLSRVAALFLVTAAVSVAVVATAAPPVPDAIGHQGRLYDAEGRPINGERQMTFSLFTSLDPQGGEAAVWTETQLVNFSDGYYAVALGSKTAAPPFLDQQGVSIFRKNDALYLEIAIDNVALSPRAKLNSVPYALVCDDATGDINPRSVSIGGTPVIDSNGVWVGSPTGLKGDQGDPGPTGPSGVVAVTKAWGVGFNPSSSLNFIGPTTQVDIGMDESVLVIASKALGSTQATGGSGLTLNICYQSVGGGALTTIDMNGVSNLRVPTGTRVIQSLSAEIDNIAGDYNVGMCGFSSNFSSWNDNGAGSVTAIKVKAGS